MTCLYNSCIDTKSYAVRLKGITEASSPLPSGSFLLLSLRPNDTVKPSARRTGVDDELLCEDKIQLSIIEEIP